MTNPDNSIGTNAAYGGRTSVNAFNDDLAAYSRGVLSGWACAPSSGLTVALGGNSSVRDVAVAEDNAGNKVTINNISGAPVEATVGAAPAANSRIDAIVAYVDNPPQGSDTIADNYEACGLIVVAGTASSSPVAPSDGAIRSAITADGASGATAYYAVLAYVTVASGATDITASDISGGKNATITNIITDTITYPNANAIRSSNYPLTAKKIGKMVFLAGTIQLTGYSSPAATLASDINNAAVLPEGVRPAMRQIFYAQSNGNVPIRVIVNADGNIGLGRYKPSNDVGFAQVAQNAAVNFTCAYVVE